MSISPPSYKDIGSAKDRVIEEIGEVLQAIGKMERFGKFNHHPSRSEFNVNELRKEIGDLQEALEKYDAELRLEISAYWQKKEH